MLAGTVELLGGLCLTALILLIGLCIVGSVVAALQPVTQANATVSTKRKVVGFVAEGTARDKHNRDISTEDKCSEELQHG